MNKLRTSSTSKFNIGICIFCFFILSFFNVIGQEISGDEVIFDNKRSITMKKGITKDDVIKEIEDFLADMKYDIASHLNDTSAQKDTVLNDTVLFLWFIPVNEIKYDIVLMHTLTFKVKNNGKTEVEIISLVKLDSTNKKTKTALIKNKANYITRKEVMEGIKSIIASKESKGTQGF